MNVCCIIPAYQPTQALLDVVLGICESEITAVVVVDDGSGAECKHLFEHVKQLPRVHLLRHAVNLGKGSALKTGLNYAFCEFPDALGFVTADADGQHDPRDIARVAETLVNNNPDALTLGVRGFDTEVPFRSRFGNTLTITAVRLLVGHALRDTQTGLRAIPRKLVPHLLKLASSGYEFELDMLIACKHLAIPVREVVIKTIYHDRNAGSHFNPVLDSMRIYFVLLRFSFASVLTALIDNVTFAALLAAQASVAQSQTWARLVALVFNYVTVKRAVFLSSDRHKHVVPRYLALVVVSGFASYGLIRLFISTLNMEVMAAKILAETMLFIANFAIQRDFVFTRQREGSMETDWNLYYKSVPPTAKITRRITASVLTDAIRKHLGRTRPDTVIELGGANSCFLSAIEKNIGFGTYHVVDKNRYGLRLLEERYSDSANVITHEGDVLGDPSVRGADLVFSVGLVEHFSPSGTSRAIGTHFEMAKPGGLVLVSFPTPTWLYRAARSLTEAAGAWKFPDERPLSPDEVATTMRQYGDILAEKTIWPIVFTQHLIVARRRT
jgi:putative flippase GtrA